MLPLLDAPPPTPPSWSNVTIKEILTELELENLVDLFEKEQVREDVE